MKGGGGGGIEDDGMRMRDMVAWPICLRYEYNGFMGGGKCVFFFFFLMAWADALFAALTPDFEFFVVRRYVFTIDAVGLEMQSWWSERCSRTLMK